jgi:hypothetical protein
VRLPTTVTCRPRLRHDSQREHPVDRYALNEARRYIRNLVAADPKLTPNGPEIINTESSLADDNTLSFDLDDGTRMEIKVRRYER